MTDLRINSEIAKGQEWIWECVRNDMQGKVPKYGIYCVQDLKGFSFEKSVVAGSC